MANFGKVDTYCIMEKFSTVMFLIMKNESLYVWATLDGYFLELICLLDMFQFNQKIVFSHIQ